MDGSNQMKQWTSRMSSCIRATSKHMGLAPSEFSYHVNWADVSEPQIILYFATKTNNTLCHYVLVVVCGVCNKYLNEITSTSWTNNAGSTLWKHHITIYSCTLLFIQTLPYMRLQRGAGAFTKPRNISAKTQTHHPTLNCRVPFITTRITLSTSLQYAARYGKLDTMLMLMDSSANSNEH